jgi:enoyl-CoA hydratase/carnithine racemase
MTGTDAVGAGFANRAFPEDELDQAVVDIAQRVAKIPPDLLALNKRVGAPSHGVDGIAGGAARRPICRPSGFTSGQAASTCRSSPKA